MKKEKQIQCSYEKDYGYNEYAVVFDDISFDYSEEQKTLKNISFKIKKSEYVALIGHNGSGKSTIAKLIIGILIQKAGDIYINNHLMTDDNVLDLRKDIGIVFQNPDNQFIGSTVRDDIAFSLENMCVPTNEMEDKIIEYASKVGMLEFLDKEPTSLSGGQKQRVAIAGTLIRQPKILVLDESTSMLDPKGRCEIMTIIHKMKETNPDLTIISITHDIDEAYQSDRVIVLNGGKVLMEGSPEEIFSKDDELSKIGLDIPFYKKLSNELKKNEIDAEGINSLESLVNKLCQ